VVCLVSKCVHIYHCHIHPETAMAWFWEAKTLPQPELIPHETNTVMLITVVMVTIAAVVGLWVVVHLSKTFYAVIRTFLAFEAFMLFHTHILAPYVLAHWGALEAALHNFWGVLTWVRKVV